MKFYSKLCGYASPLLNSIGKFKVIRISMKGAINMTKDDCNERKKKLAKPDPTSDGYSRAMLNKANNHSPYGKDEPSTRTEFK
ncbi:hypothetical protein [Clostridium sp. BL8]|nr:hypothetical protein [Clostridium sp. BL8]